ALRWDPAGGARVGWRSREPIQLTRERPRLAQRAKVVRAAREEEAQPEPPHQARVLVREQRRVVRVQLLPRGVHERPVRDRAEVPAPRLKRSEDGRMTQTD